jgi:hypothetical protein
MTDQNLNNPIIGPDGTTWHFMVGFDYIDGVHIQRIFFWDDAKRITGMLERRGSDTLHVQRLKDRIRRIAKDKAFRSRFLRDLEFPLHRHW